MLPSSEAWHRARVALAAAALWAGWCVAPALAQGEPTLDELLNLEPLPRPEAQQPDQPDAPLRDPLAEPTGPARPGGHDIELDPAVARRLAGQDGANALQAAIKEMGDVSLRLRERLDPGAQTQRMQLAILEKLDAVIAAAEQQQQSGSSQSSQSSGQSQTSRQESGSAQNVGAENQPGEEPTDQSGQSQQAQQGGSDNEGQISRAGPGGAINPDEADHEGRRWGELPQRVRDQLEQGRSDHFSSIYRQETEDYYMHIAEESRP